MSIVCDSSVSAIRKCTSVSKRLITNAAHVRRWSRQQTSQMSKSQTVDAVLMDERRRPSLSHTATRRWVAMTVTCEGSGTCNAFAQKWASLMAQTGDFKDFAITCHILSFSVSLFSSFLFLFAFSCRKSRVSNNCIKRERVIIVTKSDLPTFQLSQAVSWLCRRNNRINYDSEFMLLWWLF